MQRFLPLLALIAALAAGAVNGVTIPDVEASGPPDRSNVCDQSHPAEGSDAKGHNNPVCQGLSAPPLPTAMSTSTPTHVPTYTPTLVPTSAPTSTSAPTQAPTSTSIPPNTPTPPASTQTPTSTPTGAPSQTPTSVPTSTSTSTPTATPTSSPTLAPATSTPASTPSSTPTPANTPTQTPTSTSTPTQTPTLAPTSSPTETPTSTATATSTPTATPTPPPDVTGTITPGGPTVSLCTTLSGQNMSLAFSGTAGQKVSLWVTGSTFANAAVYLIAPGQTKDTGTYLGPFGTASRFYDAVTLPSTGTYTLLIDPTGTDPGCASFQMFTGADLYGSITPGGAAVQACNTVPGQNMNLLFSGTAGQRVSLQVSGSSLASAAVYLDAPGQTGTAGTYLGPLSTSGAYYDTRTLSTTGTYTLFVSPNSTYTGCATFTLYDVPPDASSTITPGGAAVQACNTVPGQNMVLSFSGTAGQRVSLQVTGSTLSNATVYLDAPGQAGTAGIYLGPLSTSGAYYNTQTLSTPGTYTLFVSPNQATTGCATFTLYDVPPDASGTIAVGGAAVQTCNTVPGQNMSLAFSGTAGQSVTVQVTNSTVSSAGLYLDAPGQTGTAGVYLGPLTATSHTYPAQTLATSGTYTLYVNPNQEATGCVTLMLQ